MCNLIKNQVYTCLTSLDDFDYHAVLRIHIPFGVASLRGKFAIPIKLSITNSSQTITYLCVHGRYLSIVVSSMIEIHRENYSFRVSVNLKTKKDLWLRRRYKVDRFYGLKDYKVQRPQKEKLTTINNRITHNTDLACVAILENKINQQTINTGPTL